MSFNAHVELLHQLNLHWIQSWIYLTVEAAVTENFKRVTKRAEAGFSEDVVRFVVDVAVGDNGHFGILAGEAEFNLIVSGDNSIQVLEGVDLVFEDDEISRVLFGVENKEKSEKF